MSRILWIIVSLVALGLIGFFAATKDNSSTANIVESVATIQESDFVIGEGTDKVELVEYGDFQCPACAAIHTIIKEVEEKYGDRISVAFRHFPLTSIHPNAMAAHRAAEGASKQDKFWEMHDLLYERQQLWVNISDTGNLQDQMNTFAEELDLDIEQFKTDYASQEAFDNINNSISAGKDLEVTGTPGLFLNGERIRTFSSVEQFDALFDAEIEKMKTPDTTDEESTTDDNKSEEE